MGTRLFLRDELEALDVPASCVHVETLDPWRKVTRHKGVFEAGGKHWLGVHVILQRPRVTPKN